jgi:hypothetical protein
LTADHSWGVQYDKRIQIRDWVVAYCGVDSVGLILISVGPLRAATGYEMSSVTFSQIVTASQFVRVTEDLTVSWTAPTNTTLISNYYLNFSTSSTPSGTLTLDPTSGSTKEINVSMTPSVAIKFLYGVGGCIEV